MKLFLSISIRAVLCILLAQISFVSLSLAQNEVAPAESPKKAKKKIKDSGQAATVKIDGSAVYEVPNFDSPVLEYMDQGKKVTISKKIYPGIGGLGAFYKIKIKKGVFGYITDTDVATTGKKSEPNDEAKGKGSGSVESADPSQVQEGIFSRDDEPQMEHSFFLTRLIGLNFTSYNYSEKIKNINKSSSVPMLGLMKSGPVDMLGGMPMDLNLVFTTTAPSFYGTFSSSTTGFMLIGDATTIMPIYEKPTFLIYYGFGLVLRYSRWSVALKSQPSSPSIDSQEIGIGAALTGGVGWMVSRSVVLKFDLKGYYENARYVGYTAAVQMKY